MPLPPNHGQNLRRQFLNRQLSTVKNDRNCNLTTKQKENAKKWITRYRRNWDIFAEEVLQIKMYPLQKMSLHLLGISNEYNEIATRGSAKSWRIAVAALCAFCLYPYAEIVITSSTIPQAARLVEKKIRDEIIKKLSPYLLYMWENEYIVITKSNTVDGGAYLIDNKLNGATITVAPCMDSARGIRSTFNIYEESRLLKHSIISSVFEPMGHARQAKFLINNPKYNTPRWQEQAKSVYISSARYEFEWFTKQWRNTVVNYFKSKNDIYIPFAQDIYTAIKDGSRTWADYRKTKNSMSKLDFSMEVLNQSFDEGANSFFNIKSFTDNQVLETSFHPLTTEDIYSGIIAMEEKKSNELRLVIADLAFSGDTGSKTKNDHTIIECLSLHWDRFRFERHVDYIESRPGGKADKLVLKLKEIFHDYNADYLVIDLRNGGDVIYDWLSMKTEHPERGKIWNNHGFRVADEPDYQMIPEGRQKELLNRTVDPDAIPCVIPIIGTQESNANGWQGLRKQLGTNNVKFLVSSSEKESLLEESGEYYNLTPEEFAKVILPYAQTEELIHECINLSAEYKNGLVKLVEPKTGWKDRAVVFAYGNYIADKIENKYNRLATIESIDLDELQLVY